MWANRSCFVLVIQLWSIRWSEVRRSEAAALGQGGGHVDLLEYMRSQNNMTQLQWAQRAQAPGESLAARLARSSWGGLVSVW